ncbi:SLATT domain-containing protein [Luteimonas sp. MC1825]|uniref:SLATT domain-containing protein n=1 Tax=Luteimonas sp. MC1825 TaxID=2761107 RepID=UPI0016099ED5|nr:SLATT domain-containing protein [Luteimonas sp. MC1825]MBB6600329.1 SLATT domain-containing protein [Luteimonas sp. MC1825]QOC88007.1 SLATT domain-containing protein [Luteimonas sp. MC1825]
MELFEKWLKGVRLAHIAHSKAAANDARRHKAFGIPVVIVTTIVGTAVFSSLGEPPERGWTIVAGVLSVAAAILSGLQTFLGYAASAERHRVSALKYGTLRRELEQFLEDPPQIPGALTQFADEFRSRWDAVDELAPPLPQKMYRKAEQQLENSLQRRAP